LVGNINKDVGITGGWIQVSVRQQVLGGLLNVVMNQGEQIKSNQQYQSTFGGFKNCDCA
jgi:hypothetical protein